MPDIKRKLPGRGVWISATYDDVREAVRRKVFAKGFKQAARADEVLPVLTAELLKRAALQDLSLTNKAGLVTAGFAKVEKAIKTGKILKLIHAQDAARDGTDRLDRLARAVIGPRGDELDPVTAFASAELSAALGKWNINHAALADGEGGLAFVRSAERYTSYLGPHLTARSMAGAPEQEKA